MPRLRTAAKAIAAIFLIAITGVALILATLWLDHTRTTKLPPPTGRFPVGRTILHWADPSHSDPMAPVHSPRELVAWIWYPAATRPKPENADYLPAPWRTALERQMGWVLANLVTRDLSKVQTNSLADAPVTTSGGAFPVVLIRAGLAALISNYSSLAEDLASHGYVVVGFDAPYRTVLVVLPDGTVIARSQQNNADLVGGEQKELLAGKLVDAWSADAGFALDEMKQLNEHDPAGRFTGRLDLDRVGVFGHSLGGATTLRFCHEDARCKAGIDIDGAPIGPAEKNTVRQPFLFLLSDHSREPEAETQPVLAKIRALYQNVPQDHRWAITLRGSQHFGFSDEIKSPLLLKALRWVGLLRMSPQRQLAITEHFVSTFFDVNLKDTPATALQAREGYPEVEDFR